MEHLSKSFYNHMRKLSLNSRLKINVGCGTDYKPGYIGVDRENWDGNIKVILDIEKESLPFEDKTVDEVYCSHVLEHVDRPELLISEFYRILKPGALLNIIVPHYSHPNSYQPMHKNYWGIYTKQIFDGQYFEFPDWSKVDWDVNFANRKGLKQKILKKFIKRYPSVYEGHFAAVMPIAELQFKLFK